MFPTFAAIINRVKSAFANRSEIARLNSDVDFEVRREALVGALEACGIPRWIAKRNAYAFMCLRPDFDLNAPKYRRIKALIEYHQGVLLDAYMDVMRSHGKEAADAWKDYIRSQDIFFARIVSLPDSFEAKYLFGA